jgi:hypothetical protein
MTETSFCLRCKTIVDIKDAVIKTTSNNRKMMSGICSVCNTKTNKFLKKNKEDDKKEDEKKEVKWDENYDDDKKVDVVVKEEVNKVDNLINHFERTIKKVRGVKKPLIE